MNKERKKTGIIATIAIATIALGLSSYELCYACFNLYRMGCEEEFAAMLLGAFFVGTIAGLVYIVVESIKECVKNGRSSSEMGEWQ